MFLRWREKEMGDNAENAVLAGGCAWIMQQLLRHPDGVISTVTGFMGGENDNPTEENNIDRRWAAVDPETSRIVEDEGRALEQPLAADASIKKSRVCTRDREREPRLAPR